MTAQELAFIGPHAALRARRGVPLADFLQAFRIGHRVIWDAIVEFAAEDEQAAAAALDAARLVMEFIDLASTHAAQAYLEAQQLLLAEGDRVRRDLLEDLLAGREPAPGPRLTAARAAGLESRGRCVVIGAVPVSPADDELALRSAASALARAAGGVLRPLTVCPPGRDRDHPRTGRRRRAQADRAGRTGAAGPRRHRRPARDRDQHPARDDGGPAGRLPRGVRRARVAPTRRWRDGAPRSECVRLSDAAQRRHRAAATGAGRSPIRRGGHRRRRRADSDAARVRVGEPERQGRGAAPLHPRQHRPPPACPDRGQDRLRPARPRRRAGVADRDPSRRRELPSAEPIPSASPNLDVSSQAPPGVTQFGRRGSPRAPYPRYPWTTASISHWWNSDTPRAPRRPTRARRGRSTAWPGRTSRVCRAPPSQPHHRAGNVRRPVCGRGRRAGVRRQEDCGRCHRRRRDRPVRRPGRARGGARRRWTRRRRRPGAVKSPICAARSSTSCGGKCPRGPRPCS